MSPSRYSVSTPVCGSQNTYGVNFFDDKPSPEDFPDAKISKILIRHARLIDSLEVHYTTANRQPVRHGGNGGHQAVLSLDEDEIINAVEGSFTNEAICHLTFVTGKRRIGPYGRVNGTRFTLTANETVPAGRMALISFSGKASNFILSLSATFAELPRRRITSELVKYEQVLAGDESLSAPRSAPVSQFAGYLMTPGVTLTVGPDKTKFYANEEALCRLPFFKAALQGAFREAVEKTIDMPEDDPIAVAAMVEFLYTGRYTYAYDSTDTAGLGNEPPGTFAEGMFQVAVCTTASKYGCLQLKDGAWKVFETVLQDASDIDRLRLWKAAYSDGWQLLGFDGKLHEGQTQEELRRWVGVLFEDHGAEMDAALLEDQKLARDLLRLATVNVK